MKLTLPMIHALLVTLASGRAVYTVVKPMSASSNLLHTSGKQPFSAEGLAGNEEGNGPSQPVDFFVKDFEKMDELPNYEAPTKPGQCHPKCKWTCGTSQCNTLCSPRCKAPKCVTACKKISLARCKRTCKDPQCAVVCPPQCEHGTCPKCKTVCGPSVCELSCGKGKCESTCADPDCVWDCKVNDVCAKPTCKMTCDTAVCAFGKDQALPNANEVPYMGQEIAWKGLGKIPVEHLSEFAPKMFGSPALPGGAKMFGGAKPVPKEGISSLTGDTGVTKTADIAPGVRWTAKVDSPNVIMSPSTLTDR